MASFYQNTTNLLRDKNLLYSQLGEEPWDIWTYCFLENGNNPLVKITKSTEILSWARDEGFSPESFTGNFSEITRQAYAAVCSKGRGHVQNWLYFLPFESQNMLKVASDNALYFVGGKIAGRSVYRQACKATKMTMEAYLRTMPEKLWWGMSETLESATVRLICHFDGFEYSRKAHDIKLNLLEKTWIALRDGKDVVSDYKIASYLYDPTMPEFLELYPEFTYDKLADLALLRQEEYDRKYDRLPENCRVHPEYANALRGLGRSFDF